MSIVTYKSINEIQVDKSIGLIQDNIESTLTRLREEKEEEALLTNEINKLQDQILAAKKTKIESGTDLKKMCSVLSKQVETSYAQLNALQAENRGLKLRIEDMRLESSKCKRLINSLQQDIGMSTKLARNCSNSRLKEKRADSVHQNKIQNLLSTSATEKTLINQKISILNTELVQKKEEEIKSMRKHSELMSQLVNRPLNLVDIELIGKSISKIRKKKLKKLQTKSQNYRDRVLEIKKGFDDVNLALGFESYNEFAENFIISETQIKEVQMYLLKLNAEVESVLFSNNKVYSKFKESSNNMQKPKEILQKFVSQYNSLEKKIEKSEGKSSLISQCLKQAEKIIERSLSAYQTILDNKHTQVLDVSEAKTIEEKLQMIEQIVHQGLVYKAMIAEKNSKLGTTQLSAINRLSFNKNSLENIKVILETSTIPEIPENEEANPWTPITIKNNAQRLYDQMMYKKRMSIQSITRSVSPLPSMKS